MPRMVFLPTDRTLMVNGVMRSGISVIGVPAELHAIQLYENGTVEVEWMDPTTGRAVENRLDTVGLPGGDAFLKYLQNLHAAWTPPLEN